MLFPLECFLGGSRLRSFLIVCYICYYYTILYYLSVALSLLVRLATRRDITFSMALSLSV